MNLVSINAAQASWTVVTDEIRPLSGLYLPQLIDAVGRRYASLYLPKLEEVGKDGARFRDGRIVIDGRQINVQEVGIFNDGLRAVTQHTDDSEIVLKDLAEWLKEEFQFRDPITAPVQDYQSDIVVKFDHDPELFFKSLDPLLRFVESQMTPSARRKDALTFQDLAFGVDPGPTKANPTALSIQRRANVPWELGTYFSKGLMSTPAHLRALEMLDELLAKKS